MAAPTSSTTTARNVGRIMRAKTGVTREDILKVAQPENRTRLASGGLCFDYTMRGKGRVSPYYVAFTTNDHVMNYGWTTCAAADARGNLSSNEALK